MLAVRADAFALSPPIFYERARCLSLVRLVVLLADLRLTMLFEALRLSLPAAFWQRHDEGKMAL
jgi:hypothetical protein